MMTAELKALISVVAVAGAFGACTPAPVEKESPASCEGKCDDASEEDDVIELHYGDRQPVGPVGEFGIQADWTEVVEIVVEPESRARLELEPQGGGAMPELTIYEDFGTSVEWVGESEDGSGAIEVEGGATEERYIVEIYGPPDATGGAMAELTCVAGDCGPEA